jgi:hypothetical protein
MLYEEFKGKIKPQKKCTLFKNYFTLQIFICVKYSLSKVVF